MRTLVERPDDALLRHYELALVEHGDTAAGASWPNEKDRRTRFDVMLDVIEASAKRPIVLCDLGCGTGELLGHIRRRELQNIIYIGVDRSKLALRYARKKFPDGAFVHLDVNDVDCNPALLSCDYLVANGLFTVKADLTTEQMWSFMESTLRRVWPHVRRGVAFNVMSKIVDWEREDLFHVGFDDCARFLQRMAGRRVRFRADYGLYEYAAYAYKSELPSITEPPRVAPAATPATVPVLRPKLPQADKLVPYLRRIDASRVYSNGGPLVTDFEAQIATRLGLRSDQFLTASSGTTGLIGTTLATAGKGNDARPLAFVPAFTFVATAAAMERCGYRPHLVDVDPNTWMLDPEQLLHHPLLSKAGIVVPVAPYGAPVPQKPWQRFQEQTGIPVVIDGAASFDALVGDLSPYIGDVPLVLSFHATKCFATGEGGGVVTTNVKLADKIRQALNYGFNGVRDSSGPSTNGKMSEYHAAVGLAELEGWSQKKRALRSVVERYRKHLSKAGLSDRYIGSPTIGASYNLFVCRDGVETARVQECLRLSSVDFRLWYGSGLQDQTYFANVSKDELPVTQAIAPRILGLPTAPDLSDAAIVRIVAALAAGAVTAASAKRSSRKPRLDEMSVRAAVRA